MLEFNRPEDFENMPRPRVLNAHLPLDYIPKQILEKRCKVVWIQRNIKDVIVSFYHHIKTHLAAQNIDVKWDDLLFDYTNDQSKWFEFSW